MKKLHSILLTAVALSLGWPAVVPAASGPNSQNQNRASAAFSDALDRGTRIIGRDVRGSENRSIGQVEDLVLDLESGRVLYAVLSVGGFLGLGDRLVAVPPAALTGSGNRFQLEADRQKLEGAPQYSKSSDRQSEMLSPAFARSAYEHFGQTVWFGSGQFGQTIRASELVGAEVKNISNQAIAEVNDVMIDTGAGRVALVVLRPDQSLQLRNDFYAVPPMALTVNTDRKTLRTSIDKEKLASTQGFDRNGWSTLAAQAPRIYEAHGKDAYFEGNAAAASGSAATSRSETRSEARSERRSEMRSETQSGSAEDQLQRVSRVVGQQVRNQNNENIGEIQNLVLDLESGRLLYAVVAAGGFLGLGERLVAVPPGALQRSGDRYQLNADKERLTSAPQYAEAKDRETEMLGPAYVSSVYKYFGESAWFEGGAAGGKFGSAFRVSDLLGMDVKDPSNADVGEVDNLMVDVRAGRTAFVILDPDRSLNLKNERYAVPPMALTASADRRTLTLGIDRQRLASAPGFDGDNWPNLSGPSATQVYQFYGKQPYFGRGMQPTSERTNGVQRIYHEPNEQNQNR